MAVTAKNFVGGELGVDIFRIRTKKPLPLGGHELYVVLTDYNPMRLFCDVNGSAVIFVIDDLEEAEKVTPAQVLKALNMSLSQSEARRRRLASVLA